MLRSARTDPRVHSLAPGRDRGVCSTLAELAGIAAT